MSNPNTASFPYAATTDVTLSVATDNAESTLTSAINSSVTTIPVVDGSAFTVPCLIVIDGEIIRVRTKSTNTLTDCERGFDGSTAASHSDTTSVYGYVLAYHHNQVAAEVSALSTLVFQSDFSGLKKNENLLTYSEALETGAAWSLTSGSTISATSGTSPTGTATARTLLEGASSGLNAVSSAFSSPVVAATYTFAVYAKYTNNQWLTVGQDILADTTRRVSFDIQNGVLGTQGAAATGAIVSVGNGWYRCLVVTNCTSDANKNLDIALSSADNTVSYLGTTTKTALLWGAQVLSGGFDAPLTYIKTSGASVSFTGGGDLILDEGDLS